MGADAAISLRNCANVTISGNEFSSATPPAKGAWIITDEVNTVKATANHFAAGTTEIASPPKW